MGVLKVLFLDDIPDDCTCAVCHEVLENPREFSRCQHAFCEGCILPWLDSHDSCPTCRAPVTSSDLRHLHRIWREKLYQLLMRCEFHDAGCDVTMPFKKRDAHIEECEFVTVVCPNQPCSVRLPRAEMPDHTEICQHRLVSCIKGCEMEISYGLMGEHNCIRALRHEVNSLHKEQQNLFKALKRDRDERLKLEKFVHDQACAMEDLTDLIESLTTAHKGTDCEEKKSGDACAAVPCNEKRTISLPRLAPLHTQMRLNSERSRDRERAGLRTPKRKAAHCGVQHQPYGSSSP
ncbi:PREDICTED: RING finger protein 151-like [Branchiostoma belcheri]|uniref:RING finger protein 151-like n=1 Tax=Branchiostoma belcheri TaxID=7741 RepID=A0A6P4YXF9_BRABE|nr:PREDICTED: RING finger protein 151-like [Branchiostoma belcheri]